MVRPILSGTVKSASVVGGDNRSVTQSGHGQMSEVLHRVFYAKRGRQGLACFGKKSQAPLGASPERDVPEHHRVDLLSPGSQVRYCGLGGEFFTVFADAGNLAPLTHPARSYGRVAEVADMTAVRLTESGGEQSLYRLPDDLITAKAEDSLGPFVEEGD